MLSRGQIGVNAWFLVCSRTLNRSMSMASKSSAKFTITVKETDVDPEFVIEQSPMKIGFLVEPLRKAWVPDALAQLKFSPKRKYSEAIGKILKVGLDRANFLHGAIPEELMIDSIVVNKGYSQRQVRIMGRGRFGVGYKRYSHVTIALRQLDMEKEAKKAPTWSQAQKWHKRKGLVDRLKGQSSEGDTIVDTEPSSSDAAEEDLVR
jgi:ribosomal protein L22